jgi:hypothetical protein
MHNRKRLIAVLVGALSSLALAACGSSNHARVTPAARLVRDPGNAAGKIVLSAVGAQRIGLETATARQLVVTRRVKTHGRQLKVRRATGTVIVPASAIIYDPSGKTYAYVAVGRLAFTEVPIVIDQINGNAAYLGKGPRAGSRVVSRGAEELYGVQTGVLAQT